MPRTEKMPGEELHELVDSVPTPVVVDPSPLQSQIGSGARDLMIVLGALTAIIGFLGQKDLSGLLGWLQSSEAYPFVGLVIAAGTFLWRQLKIRKDRARLVVMTLAAPNSVGVVKGLQDPVA